MVTLVLPAGLKEAFQHFPKQMTLREFLKSVWMLDRSFTRLGFLSVSEWFSGVSAWHAFSFFPPRVGRGASHGNSKELR